MSLNAQNGSGLCPPISLNDVQNCSGRGWCVDALTCACEDGWTGRGDFVFGAPTCAININAVMGLYGTLGCVGILTIICSALYTIKLIDVARSQGRRLTSSFVTTLSALACGICMTIQGFYRLAKPEAGIGQDALTTVTEALGMLTYTICAGTYYYSLISIAYFQAGIQKTREDADSRLILCLRTLLTLHVSVMACGASCLIALLFVSSESQTHALATTFLVVLGIVNSVNPMMYVGVLSRVTKFIRTRVGGSAKEGALAKTLAAMDQLIASSVYSASAFAIVAFLFAGWRDLQIHAASYFLPALFALGLVLICIGVSGLLVSLVATVKEQAEKREMRKVVDETSTEPPRIAADGTTLSLSQQQSITLGVRLE